MPEQSYRAFISYSHRDDAIARTLHKRLETYRLPKHLIGTQTTRGPVAARLSPIFRDLDELSAANDLSAEIKSALARSDTLIILASPAAKESKWVNLEIETFRALHGNARPVLVALVEGEPVDAFPPALTVGGTEPVAADFRKNASGGKRLALLKLVAGLTGAPLDALVQRDAQRQLRRVTAITGGALTAVVAMSMLLVVALRSQAEAEQQRQEAEGLVEYMLTDLRDRLKGVGRLDVMTAVNERAMKYYGGESVKGNLLKARILHALGEDDIEKGNLTNAEFKFLAAYSRTGKLLNSNIGDPEFNFVHSLSEYWLSEIYKKKNKINLSISHLNKYVFFSKKSKYIDSSSEKYALEYAYSINNLAIMYQTELMNFKKSSELMGQYISYLKTIEDKFKSNHSYELADAYAWLADSYYAQNDTKNALVSRTKELNYIKIINKINPNDTRYMYDISVNNRAIALIFLKKKMGRKCLIYVISAELKIDEILNIEPNNTRWIDQKNRIIDTKNKCILLN